jgi:hypothetical protein
MLDLRKVPELLVPFKKLDNQIKNGLKIKLIEPVTVEIDDDGHSTEIDVMVTQQCELFNSQLACGYSKLKLPCEITPEDFRFAEPYLNLIRNNQKPDQSLSKSMNELSAKEIIRLATIADRLQVDLLVQACIGRLKNLLLQHNINKPLDEYNLNNQELFIRVLSMLANDNPKPFIWLLKKLNKKDNNSTDCLTRHDIDSLSCDITLGQALLLIHLFSTRWETLEKNTQLYELFTSFDQIIQAALCKEFNLLFRL